MRVIPLALPAFVALGLAALSSEARAEAPTIVQVSQESQAAPTALTAQGPQAPESAQVVANPARIRHPFSVGLSAGVGWASSNYQGLAPTPIVGATLGVQGAYAVNRYFSVGFEFTTLEKHVSRLSSGDPFSVRMRTQADCTTCTVPPAGGWVTDTSLFFGNLAPRVELTPFGENGLYLAGSAGVAIAQLVDVHAGFGGALRAGFRYRVAKILDFGVEGGAQGQKYAEGTALLISGSAVFRPHF